jgi:hypothetical protein
MEQYFYLIWCGIFAIIWLFLFFHRKDIRKQMLIISFILGIGGVLSELVYINDWWQPITVTGTKIGIEDFIIGFLIGGISSVIYLEIFKKRIKGKENIPKISKAKNVIILAVVFNILFFGTFFFGLHSFYSSLLAMLSGILILIILRRDLLLDSLFSGLIMMLTGSAIYMILEFFQPGFFYQFWFLPDYWFSRLFLGIPIAEYIWYFLAGAFISPLYEFWFNKRLFNYKS